jgi:predicted AlkP superfamily phosphohydrolase/phosphomutase
MHRQKIAVVGWDAATFDVISPLLEAGALPNLQRLMAQGAWGPLESTVHPLSPTAWASFMTGVNPGRHGIFDFVSMDANQCFRIANGGSIKAETLWARLSRTGRRVAVINVPMTYPPESVHGSLVAGMDAPRQDRAFTYPPELADQLHKHFGGYREGAQARRRVWIPEKRFTARYIEELCDVTRLHSDVACYLLERHPVDFLMIVFTAPDRVQHALGHVLLSGATADDGIGRVYRACDQALGRILDKLEGDWITLVMSDHGACAYQRVFELSTWLTSQGWLHLRPASGSNWTADASAFGKRWLARLTGRSVGRNLRLEQFLDRITWSRTRAFALGAFGSIYINTRARFPQGVVLESEYNEICDQIKDNLLAVRDPETGDSIVRAVHLAREVYQGSYAHLAPDLLVDTNENYFVRNNLDHEEGHLVYEAGSYRGRMLAHTGRHTSNGVLIATGAPFVSGGERTGARIVDMAPTILYLSGLPVPRSESDLDGRPIMDWLEPAYQQDHLVTWVESQPIGGVRQDELSYDEQEASMVEARLRDLGYIE